MPSRRRGAQATTVQPSTPGAGSKRSTTPADRTGRAKATSAKAAKRLRARRLRAARKLAVEDSA